MIGGALDVTNGGMLHVITDGNTIAMISGALEVITGGVLEVTTGDTLDAMTGGALEVMTGGTLDVTTGGALELITGGALEMTTGGALDVMTGGALKEMTGGALEVVAAIEQVGTSSEISGTVTARIVPSIVNVAIMVIERIGCSAYLFLFGPLFFGLLMLLFSFDVPLLLFFFFVGGSLLVVVSRNDGAQVPATKSSSSLSISDLPPGYNAHLKLIFCTKCFCSCTFSSNYPSILLVP